MFSLISPWIDGWVNNGEAGDLRRRRTDHDVTVMLFGIEYGLLLDPCDLFTYQLKNYIAIAKPREVSKPRDWML